MNCMYSPRSTVHWVNGGDDRDLVRVTEQEESEILTHHELV